MFQRFYISVHIQKKKLNIFFYTDNWLRRNWRGVKLYPLCNLFAAWNGTNCNVFQFDAGEPYDF